MKFYVIYSFDTTKDTSVLTHKPDNIGLWQMTEDDDQYEYDYLGPTFKNGKHRKYYATLTKKQFKKFIDETGLVFEDIDTDGSITELGWMPAFSFHSEDGMHYQATSGVIQKIAYVTPMPEPVRDYRNHENLEDNFGMVSDEDMEIWYALKEKRYWDMLRVVMGGMF